jgi:hypothetical protein
MGIKMVSPGDPDHNPWGKKHQLQVSGWGCILYPTLILIVVCFNVFLALYYELTIFHFIIGYMILFFIGTVIQIVRGKL